MPKKLPMPTAVGPESPSIALMRDRALTPPRRNTGRPYTTQSQLAQIFDASYVRMDNGDWRQKDELRLHTAGETELDRYWKSRKLIKTTIKANSQKRLADKLPGAPEKFEHWEEFEDLREFMLWCKSYSPRYLEKPVKSWRTEDVFSFVADSFQSDAQVDDVGKPLPAAVLGDAIVLEKRFDTLVLRAILKHKLDYRKIKVLGQHEVQRLIFLPAEQISQIVTAMEALASSNEPVDEEEFTAASAALLSARREQRDVAAAEAFMLAELNFRREKARLAKVQSKLAPIQNMIKSHEDDLSAIHEHMASVRMRESAIRATTSYVPSSAENSFESNRVSTRPSTSLSSPSMRPDESRGRTDSLSKTSRPSSRSSLSSLRKMISSDMTSKAPIFQELQTKADVIRQGLRSREEAALVSRDRMREIEEERLARLREKILQEEARKEEERRIRQRKLDEADSLLTHAEETLDSLVLSNGMDERAASLQSVRRSVEGARGGYAAADAMGERRRRLVAVERLLELELTKRAQGDMQVRIARKHVESVTVQEGEKPMPRSVTERAIRETRKALKQARIQYERTGAVDEAQGDMLQVEESIAAAEEYLNRAVDEEEVLEEEVDDEGGEAVFHDSDREDDFEPVADASQEALFKRQLEQLISFKKSEALSTIKDSLYGMQAWLFKARKDRESRPQTSAGTTPHATPSITTLHSQTSTRPTSPSPPTSAGGERKLHLGSSAYIPTPVSGPHE